ncbi:hypothetical protein P7I96_33795 (plasmid) [Pseudomonas aeruginosa]|uniref:hypothetical protein n=1 Tax=Pseudomonas aeruginosa TaxID=287 RepID=UPI00249F62E1|nr:hypothetical protein [Pseudomonas aeruginosa]WGX72253.1 hypothetical protein P7I96_33795 [Pseudomonas aeruginosa]
MTSSARRRSLILAAQTGQAQTDAQTCRPEKKSFAVLDAAVHLERLLGHTPAAALGGTGSGQQAVDHAFQGEALGAVAFRVGRCVEDFPRFLIDLEAPC